MDVRTLGNDTKWIDGRMASIVMLLDMFHVHCTAHPSNLENILCVIEKIRVFAQ